MFIDHVKIFVCEKNHNDQRCYSRHRNTYEYFHIIPTFLPQKRHPFGCLL
nr:MAG TPA: hypothetical protein [Bacteriophage sp.]